MPILCFIGLLFSKSPTTSQKMTSGTRKMGRFWLATAVFVVLYISLPTLALALPQDSCTAIVCQFDCPSENFPEGLPIYSNISTAFDSASPSCASSHAPFLLILQSRGDYPGILLPKWMNRLNITVHRSSNASIPYRRPFIGGILQSQPLDASYLQLALTHVEWHSTLELDNRCFFTLSPSTPVDLDISNSTVRCRLQNQVFERLVISDSSLWCSDQHDCAQWSVASKEEGAIRITHVSTQRELQFDLAASSVVQLLDSAFLHKVSVNLETETAMAHFRNSSFVEVSIAGPSPTVTLQDNIFSNEVVIDGKTLNIDIQGNTFSPTIPQGTLSPPISLFLNTGCDTRGRLSRNNFTYGTLYLYIPTDQRRTEVGCADLNPMYRNLTARSNQFQPHLYGNASVSIMFDWVNRIPTNPYANHLIDFTSNWWGDANGPKLCCNPNGRGSFPTQLISPNKWCLDPDCTSLSNTSLPTYCLTSCCKQPDSKATTAVVILFGILAYGTLLGSLLYSIIYTKMNFTSEAFKFGRQEDMLDKIVPRLLIGVVASSIGSVSILAVVSAACSSFWTIPTLPRQEKYNISGIFVGFVFAAISVLQLIANGLLASSVLLRRKYPKFVQFVASKVLIWCGLNIAYVLITGMVWLPYGRILPKPCSMVEYVDAYSLSLNWFTSFPTPKQTLLTVALLPCGLVSLALVVPLQTFNSMLTNFEYMRINSALETALLRDLAHSSTISKKAKAVRIAASVALLLALGEIITSAYLIARPAATPLEATYWPLSILVWGVPRFINTVAACTIGVAVLCVVIWLTFSYNRATVLHIVTFLTLAVGIAIMDSNFSEFPAYGMLRTDKSKAFVLRGAPQLLGDLFGVSCFVTFIFLYRLSKSVAYELPKVAISNLNTHLDEAWSSTQSMGNYSPLLSEPESFDRFAD